MRPNMKQKARMMFHEITEIPREKYNEGLSVRKFTHDLSMAHYMYLPHTSEDIDKIMGQVGVCFAMAWQDRQMPTSAQWDAAQKRLLARVQSNRKEADHCWLLERLHEVSLEDVPWPPYR